MAIILNGCMVNRPEKNSEAAETTLYLKPSVDNPRNSEGDFITLNDGRILFVYAHYYGETADDHGSAYLAGRFSDNGGRTWSAVDKVIVENEGKMNVRSVSLLRLKNESIALFYLRHNSREDLIPMMRISTDETRTWSKPIQCITESQGYFVVNNDRIIQLANGRLLMPTSLHNSPGSQWSNKGEIRCYVSDDSGITWKSGFQVPAPDSSITQEPGVVELKDGRIMMLIRANGGEQLVSYSSDRGVSWSPAQPSGIASPISPASLERIPSTGDLLLVWNNNGATGPGYFKAKRTPLTVAISSDEGRTWKHRRSIEEDPNGMFCYTAIHQIGDHILLAYMSKEQPDQLIGLKIKRLPLQFFKRQMN